MVGLPRKSFLILLGLVSLLLPFSLAAQESAAPPAQSAPPPESSSHHKPKKQSYSHANDFLVIGTVFGPKGYAFPGVELKIRRSSEKKYRWEDYTNSRGDFAIRVPQGTQYQMLVHTKGFADQTRDVDAKTGLGETRLVFRLEPVEGKKK
ncbi:MAG TPA: carboxypeptidase-like regulatory domain-containing protein [Candidatus Acidoferrum sp.]|nr:carboxypeptidase-like regulatory domain-containing protein [Candidatus Acidoferrum sp.]